MHKATLVFEDKKGNLAKIFKKESESFEHTRATYDYKQDNQQLIINVEAKDASALRATLNSVCVTLAIYEKAKKI